MTDDKTSIGKRVSSLDKKIADVAREQRRLEELLRIKDNGLSEMSGWIGQVICAHLRDKTDIVGELKWIDKYHIALVPHGRDYDNPRIVNKGAISYLERRKGETSNGE